MDDTPPFIILVVLLEFLVLPLTFTLLQSTYLLVVCDKLILVVIPSQPSHRDRIEDPV